MKRRIEEIRNDIVEANKELTRINNLFMTELEDLNRRFQQKNLEIASKIEKLQNEFVERHQQKNE